MTAAEALRQLLAAAKQITADECKDELVWNTLGGAIGVAEMVLRDGEKPVKDHVLREVVNDLRDTAIRFHDTQQLRERLRRCLDPLLTAPAPAQPVVAAPEGAECHRILKSMAEQVDDWAEGLSYDPSQDELSKWCMDFIVRELSPAPQPASVSAAPSGEVERDAERYNEFIGAGLPICFMGSDYNDKAALDAAIDAYSAKEKA